MHFVTLGGVSLGGVSAELRSEINRASEFRPFGGSAFKIADEGTLIKVMVRNTLHISTLVEVSEC